MTNTQTQDTRTAEQRPRRLSRWRVWLWRCGIALGVPVAIGVIWSAYLVLILMDKPVVSTDYLAIINEPILAVPESDWAWPIYRDGLLKSGYHKSILHNFYYDDIGNFIEPGHPNWPMMVAHLETHAPLIQALRQGAKKPVMGAPMVYELSKEEQELVSYDFWRELELEFPDLAYLINGSLIASHQLPTYYYMDSFSLLLAADARHALERNDTDTALKDMLAQMSLVRQSVSQQTQRAFGTTCYIAIKACETTNDILSKHAHQFSDEQLVALRLQTSLMMTDVIGLRSRQEYVVLDNFQRMYGPSGKITHDGMTLGLFIIPEGYILLHWPQNNLQALARLIYFPVTRHKTATLAVMKKMLADQIKDYLAYQKLPLWEQLRTKSAAETRHDRWRSTREDYQRYRPLLQQDTGNDRLARLPNIVRAYGQTVQVVIALEQFRRAHGNFPDVLAGLVPEYLSELPLDHSTGLPLLYKLVDDKPLLYGRGLDGDDDGGQNVVDDNEYLRPFVHQQGDWILYPLLKVH